MEVRPHAVAGMFYPGDPQTLRREVRALLGDAPALATPVSPPADAAAWPKALIVPHAGYIYSGATAARAFAQLLPGRAAIRRVVLLGPVHRVPVRGLALPDVQAFSTPLGVVPLDSAGVAAIEGLPQVVGSPRAHAQEHSLEVQLPFLQWVLDDFAIVPLAVGDATPQEVAQVLDALWGGPETLIVISSDLSHYLPYDTARHVDGQTAAQILAGQPTLDHAQACGATPVNGLLLAARHHGLQPRLLAQCNSGDTAGDRARVVGYAAFAFDAPAVAAQDAGAQDDAIPADAGRTLLPIARAAIARALGRHGPATPGLDAAWLQAPAACFVTLTEGGHLRGCIGSLQPTHALLAAVRHNAVAAALHDHRFEPVAAQELDALRIEISLLSPPLPLPVASQADALRQLRPGIDGLVLHCGPRRATFLPQVWEHLPEPGEFLDHLLQKAGLPAGFWSPEIRLERYTVRHWEEPAEGATP